MSLDDGTLSGSQYQELSQALLGADFKRNALEIIARSVIEEPLSAFTSTNDDGSNIVSKLIAEAESKSKVVALLQETHRLNPSNQGLRTFLDSHFQEILARNIDCIDNSTILEPKTIQALLQLPLLSVNVQDVMRAARAAFRQGVFDWADDPRCRDFNNERLVPSVRFAGFLTLALTHYPGEPKRPTLILFVDELLLKVDDGSSLHRDLSEWMVEAKSECGYVALTGATGQSIAPQGDLQVSLMITVGLSSKYLEGQPAYQVRGALFYDQITGLAQQSPSLPLPEELFLADGTKAAGVYCLWRDLEKHINRFVRKAIQKLQDLEGPQGLNYEAYQLSLEVFLPLKHLGKAIDQLCREMPPSRRNRAQPSPLGNDFGVIVRSYDRFDPLGEYKQYEGLNETRRVWRELQTCLEEQLEIIEQFESLETITPDCFQQLEARLKQKIGLKVCCGLPASEHEQQQLFEAMLYGAAPVAVWTRSNDIVKTEDGQIVPLEISSALDKLLSESHLRSSAALSETLMRLRRAACGEPLPEKKDRCLGHHVAFLLDNPKRLPPSLAS